MIKDHHPSAREMTDVAGQDGLTSLEGNRQDKTAASVKVTHFRERDEVFWTELEIRRLGNVVAECIHARRYIGDTNAADEERKLMRKYIEAMKRKAMRVLHRAELYARSGHAAWPGIDPTITDPVSLAEEYVRVVENYEAVLSEEETRARDANAEGLKSNVTPAKTREDETISRLIKEAEDWEEADDVAYREALKREKERTMSTEGARKELLGEVEGIRQRKGAAGSSNRNGTYSKEDEELMSRHQPIQDELTSNLVDLVGQLKESITENKEKLERDDKVLGETEDAVDKNLSGVGKQRGILKKFTQSTSVSFWTFMIALVVMLVVFVFVVILLKIPV